MGRVRGWVRYLEGYQSPDFDPVAVDEQFGVEPVEGLPNNLAELT